MSLSPALESESVTADAVVTASRFCIGGQWFSYNRRIRFATTAPHPGGKRGDWISVERGRTFSTSSVIVVAKDDSRYIVAPIPGCIALIEICSSLGLSFYVNKSTDVSFPPNTSLLVREVRATCVGHAVVKGPIDTGTVVAPYGNKQIKLGKIGVLVCEVCKIGFDTIEECLLHFELPTVEVIIQKQNGMARYVHRIHTSKFKSYLNACVENPTDLKGNFNLLPQLSAPQLVSKLDSL